MARQRRDEDELRNESGRFTKDEIKDLIGKSGYPFEIEVFRAFEQAKFNSVHGSRMSTGDGGTVDVDVVASKQRFPKSHGGVIPARTIALVEAKAFAPPLEFIGFRANEWSEHERRVTRLSVSGRPNWNSLRKGGIFPDWAKRTVPAMAPMCNQVWCGQWGSVGGKNNSPKQRPYELKDYKLHHDDRLSGSLEGLLKAWRTDCRKFSEFASGPYGLREPCLTISFPAVVVGSPHVYVCDPNDGELQEHDWITVHEARDLNGENLWVTFDVVSRTGLFKYIAALEQTSVLFGEAVKEVAHAINLQVAVDLQNAELDESSRSND